MTPEEFEALLQLLQQRNAGEAGRPPAEGAYAESFRQLLDSDYGRVPEAPSLPRTPQPAPVEPTPFPSTGLMPRDQTENTRRALHGINSEMLTKENLMLAEPGYTGELVPDPSNIRVDFGLNQPTQIQPGLSIGPTPGAPGDLGIGQWGPAPQLTPPVQGVQDMIGMFDPTTIIGAPFEPPPQLAQPQLPPEHEFVGPMPPAPRPSTIPTPEAGPALGPDPRTPGEQEAVAGPLPAAPEKAGDLSRGRASGELEKLYAMQGLSEALGGMEVVTAGDILHRTAKGVGPGKPRGQALKSYTDFLAKKELGGIGSKDAMALQGLKGKQALEQIGAKDQQEIIGGLTEDQRSGMDDEARAWRTNVRIRKLQEASDAAQGLISMVEVPGTISHQMAARMLLAASGEERYSEQDIKGVIKSQGLAQGWWDYMIQKIPGKMSDRLKAEYTSVAREMKRIKDVGLHKIATDWSEGYSARSGIPASRISMEAYNIDPSKPPPSSPAGKEVYQILDTSTGVEHPATKEQWEEAKREPAGARFQAVPRNGAGGT